MCFVDYRLVCSYIECSISTAEIVIPHRCGVRYLRNVDNSIELNSNVPCHTQWRNTLYKYKWSPNRYYNSCRYLNRTKPTSLTTYTTEDTLYIYKWSPKCFYKSPSVWRPLFIKCRSLNGAKHRSTISFKQRKTL